MTVTEYIAAAPHEQQHKLREMRTLLKKAAPKAEESMKWGAAAFSHHRILFTYAGFKYHIGFYPTPSVIRQFKKELQDYKYAKGSVQFQLDEPLPKGLITKMAKYRVKELKENDTK